jgi:hypothetical protein
MSATNGFRGIRTKGLCLWYGGFQALIDVSLDAQPGIVTGLAAVWILGQLALVFNARRPHEHVALGDPLFLALSLAGAILVGARRCNRSAGSSTRPANTKAPTRTSWSLDRRSNRSGCSRSRAWSDHRPGPCR